MIGLPPKLHFGEFAVIPAVAHNAVLAGAFAGQIIGLRGAGDRWERGRDLCERAAPAKFRQARRVLTQQRFREADDIEDREPFHAESILTTKNTKHTKGKSAAFFARSAGL